MTKPLPNNLNMLNIEFKKNYIYVSTVSRCWKWKS